MSPKKIQIKEENFLSIDWDNNSNSEIKLSNLRRYCPCAVCNAARDEQSKTYIPIFSNEQLAVSQINMVGQYGVGITWKDGHNTGIYEFNELLRLSE
ncbi:MAG: DUF971 domain-containing protein [Ignavibacteria bacterium]|jgi:DUF971 family protein